MLSREQIESALREKALEEAAKEIEAAYEGDLESDKLGAQN